MGTAPKGWDSKRSAENALAVSIQQQRPMALTRLVESESCRVRLWLFSLWFAPLQEEAVERARLKSFSPSRSEWDKLQNRSRT